MILTLIRSTTAPSRDLKYRNFYITETRTWNPRNQCSGPAQTKCRKVSIKTKPIDLWKRLPVKKAKNNFPIFLSRSHSEKNDGRKKFGSLFPAPTLTRIFQNFFSLFGRGSRIFIFFAFALLFNNKEREKEILPLGSLQSRNLVLVRKVKSEFREHSA